MNEFQLGRSSQNDISIHCTVAQPSPRAFLVSYVPSVPPTPGLSEPPTQEYSLINDISSQAAGIMGFFMLFIARIDPTNEAYLIQVSWLESNKSTFVTQLVAKSSFQTTALEPLVH
ncbi:hypothetical protein WAI453_003939 [Rhynchosporium graminicola]